jgi:hypothetical protein
MHLASAVQAAIQAVRVAEGLCDSLSRTCGVFRIDGTDGTLVVLSNGFDALSQSPSALDGPTRETLALLERVYSPAEMRGEGGIFLVYDIDIEASAIYAYCCGRTRQLRVIAGLYDKEPMLLRSHHAGFARWGDTPQLASHDGPVLASLPPLARVGDLRWQKIRLPEDDRDDSTECTPAFLTSEMVIVSHAPADLPDDAYDLQRENVTIANVERRSDARRTLNAFRVGCAESGFPTGSPLDRASMLVDALYRALYLLPGAAPDATLVVQELLTCLLLAVIRALSDDEVSKAFPSPTLQILRAFVMMRANEFNQSSARLHACLTAVNVVRLEREAVDIIFLLVAGLSHVLQNQPMYLHAAMAFHLFFMPTRAKNEACVIPGPRSAPLALTFLPQRVCAVFGCLASPFAPLRARTCDSCAQMVTLRCSRHEDQPFVCCICAEIFGAPTTLRQYDALKRMNRDLLGQLRDTQDRETASAELQQTQTAKAAALADELFAAKTSVADLRAELLTRAESAERKRVRRSVKPLTAATSTSDLMSVSAAATQTSSVVVRDGAVQANFPCPVAGGQTGATNPSSNLATQTEDPDTATSTDDEQLLSLTAISQAMRRVLIEDRVETLRASQRDRTDLLRARLAAWGVDRERDCVNSTLCTAFEAGTPLDGYTTADAVAHEMAHLKFLHEYTDYQRRSQSLSHADRQFLKRSYVVPPVYPWFFTNQPHMP